MSYKFVPSNIDIGLFGMVFPMGSDWEAEGQYGCHHLMEHLICKTFASMYSKLKGFGIDWNAYTSSDRVVIHFLGLKECLSKAVPELYNCIVGSSIWTEQEFKNEKKVVLQEYSDAFNYQLGGFLDNLLRKHYRYYSPIGCKKNIQQFSYQDSLTLRKLFRKPTLICEVGGKFISDVPTINKKFPKPHVGFFHNSKFRLEKIPKEDKTIVGFIGQTTIPQRDINRLGLVLDCINGGLESPLYQEIREKRGLAYSSHAFTNTFYNIGIPCICATTDNGNVKQLRDVYSEFFSGDVSRHISAERFDACYNGTIIQKWMIEALPHTMASAMILGRDPFAGIEGMTHDKACELADKYLNIKCLFPVQG